MEDALKDVEVGNKGGPEVRTMKPKSGLGAMKGHTCMMDGNVRLRGMITHQIKATQA